MLRQYRKLEKGEFIVAGYDPAMGGGDYSAVQFISKTKLDVPLVMHTKIIATEATNQLWQVLNKIHDITGISPVIAPERQSGGVLEAERLAGLNNANKYTLFQMPSYGDSKPHESVKYGWDTNSATRPKMLADLKNAVDKHLINIYDRQTIEELFSFVIVQTSSSWKAQAEQNAHDDLVMSLAIAWQLYQYCNPPEKIEEVEKPLLHEQRTTNQYYDDILGSEI